MDNKVRFEEELERLTEALIKRLEACAPESEIPQKLLSCCHRYGRLPDRSHFPCQSRLCGFCSKKKREDESALLLANLKTAEKDLRLVHITIRSRDCRPETIKGRVAQLKMVLGRFMQSRFGRQYVAGYLCSLEVKRSKRKHSHENTHLHIATLIRPDCDPKVFQPARGKAAKPGQLNRTGWDDLLLNDRDGYRLPQSHGLNVVVTMADEGQKDWMEKLAAYVLKAGKEHILETLRFAVKSPLRAIEREAQLFGTHRFTAGKCLREVFPRQLLEEMSKDDSGLFFYLGGNTPKGWRKQRIRVAKRNKTWVIPVEKT